MHAAILLLMLSCGADPSISQAFCSFDMQTQGLSCREWLDMHSVHKLEQNDMLATSYTTLCLLQATLHYACYKPHYTMLATSHTTLCLLQATLHYACYKPHYTMLATSHTTLCLLQANKEKYCGILCKSGRGQDGLLTSDQSCLLQLVVLRKALCLCESFCGSCIEYIDSLQTI